MKRLVIAILFFVSLNAFAQTNLAPYVIPLANQFSAYAILSGTDSPSFLTAIGAANATNVAGLLSTNGNGFGVTNLNGTNIVGTLPQSALPSSVVTNAITISPVQFGAKSDGVTDDSIAISNMFAFVNTIGGNVVIDFQGKTNLYSSSPPAVNVPSITIQHGWILLNSTNGYAIGHTSAIGSKNVNGFHVIDMTIHRTQYSTMPNTNSFGICLDTDNGFNYYDDIDIKSCSIENFYDDIYGGPACACNIIQDQLWNAWSACIFYPPNIASPDMTTIKNCDMDQFNSTTQLPLPIQQTNVICIAIQCVIHGLYIEGNNIGHSHQAFKNWVGTSSDRIRVVCVNNNSGSLYTLNTNITAWEFWNAEIYWIGGQCDIDGNFGSSNYVGSIGIYSTNGNSLSMSQNIFECDHGLSFDTWDGYDYSLNTNAPNIQTPIYSGIGQPTMTAHAAFRDAGRTIFFNSSWLNGSTDDYVGVGQTNQTFTWSLNGWSSFKTMNLLSYVDSAGSFDNLNIGGQGSGQTAPTQVTVSTAAAYGSATVNYVAGWNSAGSYYPLMNNEVWGASAHNLTFISSNLVAETGVTIGSATIVGNQSSAVATNLFPVQIKSVTTGKFYNASVLFSFTNVAAATDTNLFTFWYPTNIVSQYGGVAPNVLLTYGNENALFFSVAYGSLGISSATPSNCVISASYFLSPSLGVTSTNIQANLSFWP